MMATVAPCATMRARIICPSGSGLHWEWLVKLKLFETLSLKLACMLACCDSFELPCLKAIRPTTSTPAVASVPAKWCTVGAVMCRA